MSDLEAAESILASAPSRLIALALLSQQLEPLGLRVRPPLLDGGHAHIVFPDGSSCSVSMFEAWCRLTVLAAWRCEECGCRRQPASRNAVCLRGPRVDRRYCSPACRQRAYRTRRREAS